MFIASIIVENVTGIAEISALFATVGIPSAVWLRKHGRKRLVSWFSEALSHGNSDSALLTVAENNKVALAIHQEIKDVSANLYLSELAMNARLDLHDLQADRLEEAVGQLTAVMLSDPRQRT